MQRLGSIQIQYKIEVNFNTGMGIISLCLLLLLLWCNLLVIDSQIFKSITIHITFSSIISIIFITFYLYRLISIKKIKFGVI